MVAVEFWEIILMKMCHLGLNHVYYKWILAKSYNSYILPNSTYKSKIHSQFSQLKL